MSDILELPITQAYLTLVVWGLFLAAFLIFDTNISMIENGLIVVLIILGFVSLRAFFRVRHSHANWLSWLGLIISIFSALFSLVLIVSSIVYFVSSYR